MKPQEENVIYVKIPYTQWKLNSVHRECQTQKLTRAE